MEAWVSPSSHRFHIAFHAKPIIERSLGLLLFPFSMLSRPSISALRYLNGREPKSRSVYSIKAKLSNNTLHEEVFRAGLDTHCKGKGLLSYDAWKRLNRYSRYLLVPYTGNRILSLVQSESHDERRIPGIGIARHVIWHFLKSPRTFTSDFLVTYMERYDVIIGLKTMQKYNLPRPGVDMPPFDQYEAKKHPASEETKTANKTKNEVIDKTREETFPVVDLIRVISPCQIPS